MQGDGAKGLLFSLCPPHSSSLVRELTVEAASGELCFPCYPQSSVPLGSLEPGVRKADSGFELCDRPRWRISSSRPPFLYLLKTNDVGVPP